MPTYELILLLRMMPKNELKSSLKRTADAIFQKGGIIRKLENLGTKNTPFKISSHDFVHKKANYFLVEFDSAPSTIADLNEYYGREVDIVRRRIFKKADLVEEKPEETSCTLHEEIQPPAYRKEVQEMIAAGQKQKKKAQFQYNSGLDYYPFQK